MRRPIVLDSSGIRPLDPPAIFRCVMCLEETARWDIKGDHWCANCFIHKTPWGQENLPGIYGMIMECEEQIGRSLISDGVLIKEEADRILTSIFLVSILRERKK